MAVSAKRYRILHIIDHLGTGGAQEVVCYLTKYSQRQLFQPEVLTLHGFGHYWEVLQSLGVPVYSLVPHEFARTAIPLIGAKLFMFLAKRRYDLVHTHLLGANVLGSPVAALFKVPVRFNHDQATDDVRYRFFTHRWLDVLANRLNHHIIAGSESIRRFLCQEEGVPPSKVSVIHNAVDLELLSPEMDSGVREKWRRAWGLPPDALVIGGIGRLHYQKNFSLFLKVAAEISARFPQAVFVIAGDGPDRASLEDLSRKLGIASKVRFLGFVKELRELYLVMDLLLFPSLFEGTPLTVLGALAVGLPVVASNVDGIAETLADGKDALLVPPEDKELFVRQVCRLLADRELAQRLAQAGQEKVRRHYSAEAMVRQVEALYMKYLGDKGVTIPQ